MYDYAIRLSYDDGDDDYIIAVSLEIKIMSPNSVLYKFSDGNEFLRIVYH